MEFGFVVPPLGGPEIGFRLKAELRTRRTRPIGTRTARITRIRTMPTWREIQHGSVAVLHVAHAATFSFRRGGEPLTLPGRRRYCRGPVWKPRSINRCS